MNRLSLYDKLATIKQRNLLHFTIRFGKVCMFHAIFECLISIYLMELVGVVSPFFIESNEYSILLVVVLPPAIVLIVALLFGILVAIYFVNVTYRFLVDIDNRKIASYSDASSKYRKKVIFGHTVGMVCYSMLSFLLSLFLIKIHPELFDSRKCFVFWMTVLGTALGFTWNITGYFRDQRILWYMLPVPLTGNKNDVKKANYKYFVINAVFNMLSILFLMSIFVVVVVSLYKSEIGKDRVGTLLSDYSAVIIYIVVLVVYYVKNMYALIYSNKNKKEAIYPPLKKII